jgi:hypothetical protein
MIYPMRAGKASAIAARQKDRLAAETLQLTGDLNGKRRLARAACREIADADNRES